MPYATEEDVPNVSHTFSGDTCIEQFIQAMNDLFIHPDRTIAEIYEATCKKTQQLRNAGYNVIEKWEHDFEREKKTDPALIEFLNTFLLAEPLNPRDSFFGGRTNGVR